MPCPGKMAGITKWKRCFQSTSFSFSLADGKDYKAVSSLITFQANQVMEEVMVVIGNDQDAEPVEYFTMRIEAVEGGVAFPITEAIVHINDDDSQEHAAPCIILT